MEPEEGFDELAGYIIRKNPSILLCAQLVDFLRAYVDKKIEFELAKKGLNYGGFFETEI